MDDIERLQLALANTEDGDLALTKVLDLNGVLRLKSALEARHSAADLTILSVVDALDQFARIVAYLPVLRRYLAVVSTSDMIAWKLAFIHGFIIPPEIVDAGNRLRSELAKGPLVDFLDTDWFRKEKPEPESEAVLISSDPKIVVEWGPRPFDKPTRLVGGRPMPDMGFKEYRHSSDGSSMDEVQPEETLVTLRRDINEILLRLKN